MSFSDYLLGSRQSCINQLGEQLLNAVFDTIADELARGENVTLVGFGVFKAVDRAKKTGRNPITGEKMGIPARTVPKFTAGKALKEAVRS